jgi:hypothetical protein
MGPVAVVRGLGVQLVRAAELSENLHVVQLGCLEPVDEIVVDDRVRYHHTISAGKVLVLTSDTPLGLAPRCTRS